MYPKVNERKLYESRVGGFGLLREVRRATIRRWHWWLGGHDVAFLLRVSCRGAWGWGVEHFWQGGWHMSRLKRNTGVLQQGSLTSGPQTCMSCQIRSSIRLEIKCTINVMCLNHPETITHLSLWKNCLPQSWSLVPRFRDHWATELSKVLYLLLPVYVI